MDHSRPNRTLRATLIEPFKQISMGIYLTGMTLTFIAALLALVLRFFWEQYEQLMRLFEISDPATKWELVLNDVFYSNITIIGFTCLGFVLLLMATVVRVTHRYYGPIVSINRFLDGIIEGDYSHRVSIRKGDELQDLVIKLNLMASHLEQRHGAENHAAKPPSTENSTDRKPSEIATKDEKNDGTLAG